MGDLTRRAFIGRTLLTGATIASGGLSTISTTPKVAKVAKVATTFKNLNVLSPKAKAYRMFLRGLVGGAITGNDVAGVSDLRTSTKTLLTRTPDPAVVFGSESVSSGKNVGRRAFETAIKKPDQKGPWKTSDGSSGKNATNPGAADIAADMRTDKTKPIKKRSEFSSRERKNRRKLAAKITGGARTIHAHQLRKYRKANPNSQQALAELKVRREFQAHDKHTPNIQATKTTSTTSKGGGKSGGGGGGKFGRSLFGRHSPWSLLRNDKNF